jgi:hypothetical protein
MRKRLLLALWLCVAASQGLVSGAEAEQAQTAGRAAPVTGKQASAQEAAANRPPAIPAGFRLLSLKEGRALVQGMAWADDEEGLAPDCSHLVHTLYQQAGYPYPYASSLDLYLGTGQFWRVPYAQPGDLIVWRGHVGIVVDPKEHSFFSSVTSGTRIQDYHSAYWQARGYPRFYRYLTKSALKGGGTSEVADQPSRQQPNEQPVLGSAERPSLQTVKTSPVPTGAALGKPRNAITAARAENASQPSPSQAPLQILLRTSGKQPKSSDVTSALQAVNLEAGELLRAGNLEQLERPVVVYRQLQVSGVELKGKRGMAQIQMETVATLTGQRMESQPGWEDHELELERTKKGWVMVQGIEIAYVPRDGAMRILAARLAALTQSTERSTEKDREQAHIVRFMSLLVE